MTTVELFAGIGGFRIAADQLKFKTIWANEICPKACAVYRHKFGAKELEEGDIYQLKDKVPAHQLLTGGFPCQPFSSAGKKQGIRDPRGTLFSVIVEILEKHEPKYFLLENVKRLLSMEKGAHFATILAALSELGYLIEWRLLNALHFSLPQNRQRVIIIGTRDHRISNGRTRFVRSIPVHLATKDDLEILSNEDLDWLQILLDWTPIENHGKRFPAWGMSYDGKFFARNLDSFSEQSKLVKLRAALQNENEIPESFDMTKSTIDRLKVNTTVNRFVSGVQILSNQGGGARMGYTIFGIDGIAPTLTATPSRHYERYKIGNRYRRLTNIEYARIQGFPEDHCATVSVYDQYMLFGNAVPPPLAKWAMSRLKSKSIPVNEIPRKDSQARLFEYAE